MAAGIATLRTLLQPGFYERLESLGAHMEKGLRKVLTRWSYRADQGQYRRSRR